MSPPLVAFRSGVAAFDKQVDAAFDVLRGRGPVDQVFYAASELGDYSVIWVLLGGLRGLRSEHDWHAALRMGGGVAAESFLVNALIKSLFRRTRPPSEAHRPLKVRRPRTSSFPSGHATSACVASILLSDGDPLWPLYYGLAAVVATSRVYTKMHHASDVVAGVVVGVALGVAGRRLVPLPPVPGSGSKDDDA